MIRRWWFSNALDERADIDTEADLSFNGSSDVIRLNLPGSYKYLNILSACISSLFETGEGGQEIEGFVYQIQLAVHELCSNIVEHAYASTSGRIDVVMMLIDAPMRFVIDLRDTGSSFLLSGAELPNLDEAQTEGYGLYLIQQIMDQVVYDPRPGNNYWRLEKNLEGDS